MSAPRAEEVGRFEDVDVLVQGEGIRRGVAVEVREDGLRVGDLAVRGREIWWTSRRAGLLMLFGRERTLAVKGDRPVLDALARVVEARRGAAGSRGRLPDELTGEVVVCTAGTAVVGRVGGRETSGLRVAVATRRGLHLMAGERDLRLGWPVDEARVTEEGEGGGRGRALVLRKGEDVLRLLYLFPEETDAVLRAARGGPEGETLADGVRAVEIPEPAPPTDEAGGGSSGDGDDAAGDDFVAAGARDGGDDPEDDAGPAPAERRPGGAGGAESPRTGDAGEADPPDGVPTPGDGEGPELEMFDRREVAGPIRPELPEFRLSVDVLRAGARDAAGRLAGRGVEEAGLAPHFLETHFLELGETALGPLLLRKSAAATAQTLERALEAMDASELEEDTEAAASNAADRMLEVYGRELDRLLSEKRAPASVEEEHGLTVEEREDVRLRIHAPFEKLAPLFRDLEERQQELRRRVQVVESGPPGGDDRDVREAAGAWRKALERVDRGFVDAWDDVVDEIAAIWRARLLPSLAEVGSMRRRRLPEWARLVLLAVASLLAAAGLAVFLLG
jgi:hypothetical protein